MKKIIIIFLALISIAHAQDSTRANFPTDRGGFGYKINATELNGRPLDSTRFYKMGSDTVKRVTVNWQATFGGVYGNGSDMTSKINLLDKRSYVNEILFVYDTLTTITVSGSLSVTKTVRIAKGTSFTGSGSVNFNNNIIDADPDQALFATSLTITNPRSKLGYIPAKWFFVVADGTTNDYTAMTKVMSATPKDVPIGLPAGKTMVGSTLSITRSIIGLGNNKASSIIYNTSASGTDLQLANVSADSVKIFNVAFNGSNKCRIDLIINNNYKGIEIGYCDFINVEQQGSETNNSAGLVVQNSNDGLWVHHNYFTNINAKNNGVSRGIWATGTTSPKRAIIEFNKFDGISNTGSGSLDADQIVWQDYTDSAGLIIRFNEHYNIYKRGQKLQAPGVLSYNNTFYSTAYKGSVVSNSAISLYRNQTQAINNYVYDGVFEKAIEIGDGSVSVSDISVVDNYIKMSTAGAQTSRDAIVALGLKNRAIKIAGNKMYNGRRGVWVNDGGRGYIISGNEAYNMTDNSFSVTSANSYPDNWHYDVQVIGNKAFKGQQAAFAIGRINGGCFIGNSTDTTSDDLILNYAPYIDSLIGVIAIGNTTSPVGYGSGKRVNIGTYAQRLPLSNPKSLPGLQYIATDNDSNFTYMWQGGAYVKIGAAAGGGSGTVNSGAANRLSYYPSSGTTVDDLAAITASRALASDANGLPVASATTATELGYLSGVGSAIQTQLDGKVGTGRTITINGTTYDLSANRSWSIDAVPTTRTITINGTTYDLSANRSWTIPMTVDTGSYIPTIDTSGSAINSYTVNRAFWERRGDRVRVWGTLTITTLSNSVLQAWFTLSLPSTYPSTFTDNWSLSGIGSATTFNDIKMVRVYPFYTGTPRTDATVEYIKPANTPITYDIDYKYDYLISND